MISYQTVELDGVSRRGRPVGRLCCCCQLSIPKDVSRNLRKLFLKIQNSFEFDFSFKVESKR